MTDCLNQRDRHPVVNTSSLHSAKTRAKTKQKKLTQKQTKIHRVTTDMCGITNSSTCFSLEAQRWDVQQFSLTSGRPSSGHQGKLHSSKTFRHFLPSWKHHHSNESPLSRGSISRAVCLAKGCHISSPRAINTKKGLRQRRW